MRSYTAYEASAIIAAPAAGAVFAQLTTNPSVPPAPGVTLRMGLTRLEIILTTAVQTFFALSQCNAVGTATTSVTGNRVGRVNGGYAFGSAGSLASAWSVAPTIASKLLRRGELEATIGASVVWEWPESDPFTINMDRGAFADTGIVLHNLGVGAGAAMLVNARWLEYNADAGA